MRYYVFAFIIYEFLLGAYFYNEYIDSKNEYHKQTINLVNSSLNGVINGYEMAYDDFYATQSDRLSKLVYMANYASLKKRNVIRKKLLNEFMSFFTYKKLNSLNGFQIFDIEGRSLLRFHQPKYYDDYIINKRYSLKKMQKEFLFQKGFEIGVFQESFHFEYPLFYDGEFVGSYEYSVDPEAFMSEMTKINGGCYQLLFKSKIFEKIIIKKMIDKNYKKVKIGSEFFYLKKNGYKKEISKDRLENMKRLESLQKALHLTVASVIDYRYNLKDGILVVLPIKDIEGKYFAYMLINDDKSELSGLKNTLLIEMVFITLLGLLFYLYIYREIKNRQYVKELINLQRDLIIVTNGKYIEDANNAFLDFFDYKNLETFKRDHPCVCDMFLEEDGYLQEIHDEVSWIRYVQDNSNKDHKVKMLNTSKKERVFKVEIEMIKGSHRFFILFRDITEELYVKEQLEERANFDVLTQIFNRSRFEFFLNKEIEKATRYGGNFSLIMFDIDHFKVINDTQGHDIGDVVLKELTALVSSHTRDVDIFARWGGEEFMIISQTDIYQSEMFAEKLRKIIDENIFTNVDSVTCSFGVTQYKKNDTMESIVKRCDNMLYSAKESGRNCVASLK